LYQIILKLYISWLLYFLYVRQQTYEKENTVIVQWTKVKGKNKEGNNWPNKTLNSPRKKPYFLFTSTDESVDLTDSCPLPPAWIHETLHFEIAPKFLLLIINQTCLWRIGENSNRKIHYKQAKGKNRANSDGESLPNLGFLIGDQT
jgi:hypothetical protein